MATETTNTAAVATAAKPNASALVAKQKNISDSVLERVNAMQEAGELVLPDGYHAGNAVRFAWLAMQEIKDKNGKPALEVCTQNSIANSMLEMIINGESIGKKHGYFIVTGNKLTFFEDYRGKYMRAKRDTDIERINAQVVYEGDNFVYMVDENGEYQLVKHETKFENIDTTKIKGAYAVVINKDGSRHLEIMSMEQIRASWQQGAAKGNSMAHTKFTDQMCKKTIISRACKIALGSTADELGERDLAKEQREAAQQPANAVDDVDYTLVEDAAELVDTATGEVINVDAAPADAEQPKTDCPL